MKLFGDIPQTGDPISQAREQWHDRMMQKYWPQVSGSDIKFHIDGDDPLQQQLLGMATGAGLYAKVGPSLQAMVMQSGPGAAPTNAAGGVTPPAGPGGGPAAQ